MRTAWALELPIAKHGAEAPELSLERRPISSGENIVKSARMRSQAAVQSAGVKKSACIEGSSSRAPKGACRRCDREIEDKVNDFPPREDKDVTFETLNRPDFLDALSGKATVEPQRCGGDCSSRPRLGQANASSRRECKRL